MIHQFEKHISTARQVEPAPAREIETDELVLCLVEQAGLFGCREPFTKEPHCLQVCLVPSLAYDGIDICRRHFAETSTFGYPDHSPRERESSHWRQDLERVAVPGHTSHGSCVRRHSPPANTFKLYSRRHNRFHPVINAR
jgi:hypothetical protein